MPRVLFVTTVAGTLEAFLLPYATMLRTRGWRVDAVARQAPDNEGIVRAFDNTYDIDWSRRPWEVWRAVAAARRIARIANDGKYDIVHVHTPIASFVARLALRTMRARPAVVYTAHGFHFYSGGGYIANAVFLWAEEAAAGWTDWIVTMNREDVQAAQKFGRIRRDRVRHIPGIGVDCDQYRPLGERERSAVRIAEGIGRGQFAVAVVGEFTPQKRQELAVDALLRAGPGIVGIFIGEGPRRPAVEGYAKARNAPALFLGYRRDAGRLIAACDALLHVSRREGLPRVVLEAVASAVPVVGTRARGTADILEVTGGIIVDRSEAGLLGDAVRSLAQDPERARSLGRQGLAAARATFGLHRTLDEYRRLYEEALSQRASPA